MAKFKITYFLTLDQKPKTYHKTGATYHPGDILLDQVWEGYSKHGAFHHAMHVIDSSWGNNILNSMDKDYRIEPYTGDKQ